jgi:hypothetical protein
MVVEAAEPLPVVRLAEEMAATPEFVAVDLERLANGDEHPEQYLLTAHFAERRDEAGN